ncbi:hypothetical protein J3E64_001275 [Sphingobium sp. OAS761]|uniref:hypothetical protein n=1 Tax=Sphingobium sp. OAS761 TaxID=2817901 RepID=UPI00209DA86F|nr:hypothetical protein [Sphingobium sp. OAS761]MCP1469593.1 hypothetical protein [Sphingobium sp. OAS761]
MSRTGPNATRWSIASRTLAAALGGYALTSLATITLPLLLETIGVDRSQALITTMMAGFLMYAAIIMAVFHARSAMSAWAWLVGASLALGIVVLLLPGATA